MGTQVVVLVGNLGKDAELRLLPNSGKPILNFDLPIDIGFGAVSYTHLTGVWIRNDDTPEQVYDKVTQIFPAEWTVRFYQLVSKGYVT